MVVLLIQTCGILSIWDNVENDERLHTTPQQNVLQKLSTCALDPSLLLAENSFLRWKYLPLAASLGQNVMSVRENPTISQAFRNSKFQFQS